MVKDRTYIHIESWMRNELGLSDTQLMLYAMIYGFSMDGESEFSGSINYMAEWVGCCRNTIVNNMAQLIDKGYIIKRTFVDAHNVKACRYVAVVPSANFDEGSANFGIGSAKTALGGSANIGMGGSANSAPNTIDIYNTRYNSNKFSKPTLEEVSEYIKEKGYNVDPEAFWNFYESKGWLVGKTPMKSWQSAVVTWSKGNRSKASSENEHPVNKNRKENGEIPF